MKNSTYKWLRNLYYLGIVLLITNTLPILRHYIAFILDFQILGLRLIEIIAVLIFFGVIMAYKNRFF